jgi:hypothetical protein
LVIDASGRIVRTIPLDGKPEAGVSDPYRIDLAGAKYQDPPAGAPANARPTIVSGSTHLLIYGINGR